MRTTRTALVSLWVVLVAACAAPPQGGHVTLDTPRGPLKVRSADVKTCNDPSCRLDVVVSPGSPCTARVEAKVLKVTHVGRVTVHWHISGPPRAAFAHAPGGADGIKPHDPKKFDGRTPGARTFVWRVDNSARTLFEEYDINTTVDGKPCSTVDPYIMN